MLVVQSKERETRLSYFERVVDLRNVLLIERTALALLLYLRERGARTRDLLNFRSRVA